MQPLGTKVYFWKGTAPVLYLFFWECSGYTVFPWKYFKVCFWYFALAVLSHNQQTWQENKKSHVWSKYLPAIHWNQFCNAFYSLSVMKLWYASCEQLCSSGNQTLHKSTSYTILWRIIILGWTAPLIPKTKSWDFGLWLPYEFHRTSRCSSSGWNKETLIHPNLFSIVWRIFWWCFGNMRNAYAYNTTCLLLSDLYFFF